MSGSFFGRGYADGPIFLSARDATQDKMRQQVYAQLRESKSEEETELWLRRLRDEAFVEYRM